jgi:hypothetical protein
MQKFILILSLCLLEPALGSAQSLDKLMNRAHGYLEARAALNRTEMGKYAQADKRTSFLQRTPPPMSKAKIDGLDFTTDPKTVNVRYSATFTLDNVGDIPTQVREAWLWDGKDWFLKLEEIGNIFEMTKNKNNPAAAPEVKPFTFELATSKIDFGKHTQGEVIKQVVEFKSNQDTFHTFTQNDTPGLLVTGPTWLSKETGQLEVVLDTTLLSANVNYSAELDLTDWHGQKTKARLAVTAEIEPRLRFTQNPKIVDPAKAGTLEIQIENLSTATFKPTSLVLSNPAYQISDYTPNLVGPGQTLKIVIAYQAQPEPTGVALTVQTSPAALAKPNFVLPINVKLPVSQGAGYTKEELDEIIKKAR